VVKVISQQAALRGAKSLLAQIHQSFDPQERVNALQHQIFTRYFQMLLLLI